MSKHPHKYKGRYTKARDCKHTKTTSNAKVGVEVSQSCPEYGKTPNNLIPALYCQYQCSNYEKTGVPAVWLTGEKK